MRVCDLTNNRSVWSDPDPKLKRNVSTTVSPEGGSILRDVKHLFFFLVCFSPVFVTCARSWLMACDVGNIVQYNTVDKARLYKDRDLDRGNHGTGHVRRSCVTSATTGCDLKRWLEYKYRVVYILYSIIFYYILVCMFMLTMFV